jgi:hypothetical protein
MSDINIGMFFHNHITRPIQIAATGLFVNGLADIIFGDEDDGTRGIINAGTGLFFLACTSGCQTVQENENTNEIRIRAIGSQRPRL